MVAGSTASRSPSRSPSPTATVEELQQLNSTLRSRLARSVVDLQAAAVSRDAAVDHQHQFSLTLLRQTRELRTLERLYDTRQAEVVRLRGENAAFRDTENPDLPPSPTVVNLESQLRQQADEIRDLDIRLDQAISDRDTLQDQSDHLAEEVRLAGVEIEQLQEDHYDLDRARENAEHELQLSEASLVRVQTSLVQAENQIPPPAISPANVVAPDVDRLTRERDEARTAATDAEGQLAPLRSELTASRDMHRSAQIELNCLRSTHAAATADLIQTVKDRDAARADASRYRDDASDLQRQLAAAAKSHADPAKRLAYANRRLGDLQHSNRVLLRERDAARQARDQIRRSHDAPQREFEVARQKLAVVASTVGIQPAVDTGGSGPAATLRPLPATPVGPQGDTPSAPSKRPRGSPASPESSSAPPAKRRVAPLSPDTGGSSGSAEGDPSNPMDLTHDDEPHPGGGAVSDDGGHANDSGSEASHQSSAKKSTATDSGDDDGAEDENEEGDEDDEDDAEVADELLEAQTLQALAQSRSAERRRRQASPRQGPKVSGSGASPDGSDDSDSNRDPAPGSASRAGSSGKPPASSRRRSSEPSGPMSPVAPFGPEELCIPGRAQARKLIEKNVDPWLAGQISDLAMVTMLINHLFPVLPTKPGWLFPRVDSGKRQQYTAADFCADLISEANVRALMEAAPWKVLEGTGAAISFETDVGGRLMAAIQRYNSHEAESLQSYWESTHSFPITHAMVKKHPWLAVYRKERNNRRSHAGNRWKAFLELLILALREGWCALDLLLDPFFLHFPKRSETVTWFPCLTARQANLADPNLHRREPVDLLAALDEDNSVDPWHKHYRDLPQQHPANSLSRLTDKFFGVQAQDAE
ncbi:hypothetical protein PR001_g4362 [Phytophthora rubi]|uniref:Uncharacterized protein n=1 Tax=Phytophthora rubi TaxID=129364 RepID=A0A6A3NWG2_9STRA|nr:hypothetical protein PR002_g6049 [Phytophthora rubi]KAE9047022.1 hypothetical protein PR001_g4362 [Phytophthora rubi]